MNVLFSKFKNSKVAFTRHAQDRAVQRFKLFMLQHERDNVKLFLYRDFNSAEIDMSKQLNPFYINKNDAKYGKNSFVARSKNLNYYGNYDEKNEVLVIRTIVSRRSDIRTW